MTNLKSIRSVAEAYAKMVTQEGAPADAKAGPEDMDPATKKMKGVETKVEDAPYTNKADGSENVVPADKPAANPSEMPTLKKETTQKESTTMTDPKSIRSVAEAYAEMTNEATKKDTRQNASAIARMHTDKAIAHVYGAESGGDYAKKHAELHGKASKAHQDAAKHYPAGHKHHLYHTVASHIHNYNQAHGADFAPTTDLRHLDYTTESTEVVAEGAYVGGPEHTHPQWIGGINSKKSKEIRKNLIDKGHGFDDYSNAPSNKQSNTHHIGMHTPEGHAELQKIKKKHGLGRYPYGTPGHVKSQDHTGKAEKEDLPTHVQHAKGASYL